MTIPIFCSDVLPVAVVFEVIDKTVFSIIVGQVGGGHLNDINEISEINDMSQMKIIG